MNLQGLNGNESSSLVELPHHMERTNSIHTEPDEHRSSNGFVKHTPLSIFVRERLSELGLKQADFCRLNMFDQGMLSRIQNSAVFNLNLESALRLAIGLKVSPIKILELIERPDLHELILGAYANDLPELLNFQPPTS